MAKPKAPATTETTQPQTDADQTIVTVPEPARAKTPVHAEQRGSTLIVRN